MSVFKFSALASLLVLLVPATGISATISNSVFARTACGSPATPALDLSSTSEIEQTYSSNDANCTANIDVYANEGVVGISGLVTQDSLPGKPRIETDFSADAIMSGIVISAASGFTNAHLLATYGATISVAVNAEVEATMSADLISGSASSRNASAGVRAFAEISGFIGGAPQRQSAEASGQRVASNISGATGPTTLMQSLAPSIDVTWSTPFQVIFRLQGEIDTFGGTDSKATGQVDASNSLSFSKTGPAFILPTGFTVNAPELGIFDNRWIDPRVVAPSVVPIPAGLPLLLTGLGVFVFARRRQV